MPRKLARVKDGPLSQAVGSLEHFPEGYAEHYIWEFSLSMNLREL